MTETMVEGCCLPCKGTKTREWYAWNDLMPPQPDYFHITGEVLVGNPGIDVILAPTYPPGINPTILMLDIYLCQRPGIWPTQTIWKHVRFDKKITTGYEEAHIMCSGEILAKVEVENIK